jgi:hypothetical protein
MYPQCASIARRFIYRAFSNVEFADRPPEIAGGSEYLLHPENSLFSAGVSRLEKERPASISSESPATGSSLEWFGGPC